MVSDLHWDVFVGAIILLANSFHSYMQRCPHSTSMYGVKTSIKEGKSNKNASAFVTLLRAGVCVCSVTHKSTCFRLISNLWAVLLSRWKTGMHCFALVPIFHSALLMPFYLYLFFCSLVLFYKCSEYCTALWYTIIFQAIKC